MKGELLVLLATEHPGKASNPCPLTPTSWKVHAARVTAKKCREIGLELCIYNLDIIQYLDQFLWKFDPYGMFHHMRADHCYGQLGSIKAGPSRESIRMAWPSCDRKGFRVESVAWCTMRKDAKRRSFLALAPAEPAKGLSWLSARYSSGAVWAFPQLLGADTGKMGAFNWAHKMQVSEVRMSFTFLKKYEKMTVADCSHWDADKDEAIDGPKRSPHGPKSCHERLSWRFTLD